MIGVICNQHEEPAVREFFELFKSPWAMFDPSGSYDVVIQTAGGIPTDGIDARLLVRFADHGDRRTASGTSEGAGRGNVLLTASGAQLPIFGDAMEVAGDGDILARLQAGFIPIVRVYEDGGRRVIRCGYSLFDEVEFLLGHGQPAEHAQTPTLDRHIELLRGWMVEAAIEFVELYPAPPDCALLACLTHDVDFLGIRRHTHDRTLIGFLYRATVGSAIDVIRGRGSVRKMLRNWRAVFSLPLVYAGLLEDFWSPFEQYAQADAPWRSTFFIIPFRGRPGRARKGESSSGRGVPYGASEIAAELRNLAAQGHEIAVHGVDAWCDSECGSQELATVRDASETDVRGVRMHWLYFDAASPLKLERAGFDYDATRGYNETVGFHAGTAQVFAPLQTERILELPLLLQDTALLYPGRMHCSEDEALGSAERLLDAVSHQGGVATISWHERSLAPERLWDRAYDGVLAHLRARDAWVRPAREVVAWFRARRSIDLEGAELTPLVVSSLPPAASQASAESLRLRIHHPAREAGPRASYTDLAVLPADLASMIHRPHLLVS